MKTDLSVIFDGLEDPRIDRKKLYPIGEIRLEWLRQFMPFTNGIPSHQTIGRVFSLLSPSTLEVAFIQFMSAVLQNLLSKSLRSMEKPSPGSFDKSSKKAPIHILHAWAVNNGFCIGQLMVDDSTKEDKTTKETRFFIMTFPPNVEHFANYVRGYWGVENKLHWVLDVTFQEDHSRVGKDHAPRNMSLIRKIAANFLRKDKNDKRSLNIKKMIAGLDPDFQTKILKENGF